jgi:hypothetical protein
MMRAYIDESGQESTEWVVVAGFLGNEDQWAAFVPKWTTALGRQRKSLHMSALRWNKTSTRDLLARLGPVPYECGLEATRGVVRVSDYADLVAGTDAEKDIPGYYAALVPMVINILRRAVPPSERIEFVFERQDRYILSIARAMAYGSMDDKSYKLTSDGRPKIARWVFVEKGTTVMTDPADYLAFALRSRVADPESKKAEWSRPIITSNTSGVVWGKVLTRSEARQAVKMSLDQDGAE